MWQLPGPTERLASGRSTADQDAEEIEEKVRTVQGQKRKAHKDTRFARG
jgi:hypothetical protein